ncbi:hypothetical protein SAMN02745126_06246 [Enhydrobacter aerosaccus]|uniref:Pre-peptidase C-terminal domain-containing protein n=1 Tax=Enhydrobacter aerosaccus TaxID=225324 RepID=A0A1T4TGB4_9HYPH|nr:hypothetical protein [Enhydrobacter aerosaccus]SKA39503.1 hypothetical protein SAMN02745126_06246 [Enhydrobacter aerosaccus]
MKSAMAFCLALLSAVSIAYAADPGPQPVPKPRAIFFATGSSKGTVGGHVARGERDLYSLGAKAGQIMTITITAPDDNAVFQIYEPGTKVERDADGTLDFKGKPLPGVGDGDDATRWSGRLPQTGLYLIVVGGTRGNARYSMDVKIE